MTVNRTTLLDLPLPVTGTESGTWGDTTNNGLTQYMDIAIAGMSNLTSANFTTGALTIETTEGDSSATNISATSAQYAGFRVTSLAQNSTITVGNTGTSPARSYRLINADATYTLTFKATGQTGITLQPGQTAVVAFNGTDYVIVGMAGAGTVTDNAVVRFDGTTGKLVQNSVVTIADSTGDVAGVGALTASGNLTLSGGTANGVLYLNGSKVATSGSALTFDGTKLINTSGVAGALIQSVDAGGSGSFLRILGDASSGNLINWTTGTALRFATSDNAFGSFSEKMRLASATGGVGALGIGYTNLTSVGDSGLAVLGNVGIGTSSPQAPLHVAGASGSGTMQIGRNTGAAQYQYINFGGNTTGDDAWQIGRSSNSSGLGGDGAFYIYDLKNSTTRLSVTTSGNLGLGVTPSAWGSAGAVGLQVGTALALGYSNATGSFVGGNAYYSSSGWKRITTGAATAHLLGSDGAYVWYNTSTSSTADSAITFTQAMTLDASGNLGVGTTSPGGNLHVNATGNTSVVISAGSTGLSRLVFQGQVANNRGFIDYDNTSSVRAMIFRTNESEAMRIDSSGNLLVNRTGTDGSAVFQVATKNDYGIGIASGVTTTQYVLEFRNGNGVVGTVTTSGTATAYNTSSDYRLKDNPQPLTGSGAFIDALQPKTWNWKADGSRGVGFIAHEVQEVSPGSVVGEKDGEQMQAMEYGSAEFIANIIAELQSLRQRVAQLEGTQP